MLDYLRIMLNAQKAKMDERGASAVEYGLLIAGIAALIIVVIFAFGGVLNKVFQRHLWLGQQPGPVWRYLLTSAQPGMAADLRDPRPSAFPARARASSGE